MNYYAFMFMLRRTQIVQYNCRVLKINNGEVQDLIKAEMLYLEYKLFMGEGFLAALMT